MITSDFKKKMTDSWFSYLQSQICKEFEYLEDNKEDMSGYLKSMGKKPDKSSDVQNYMTLKKMMKKKKTNEGSCGQVDYGSDKSIKIMKKKTPGETNEKITLAKVRGTMYKGAKALGDVQAVRKKKVGKRVARRVAGKVASRVLRNLIK